MSSPRHSRQRRPPWGDGQTVLLRSAGLGLALSVFAVAAVMVPSVWGDAAAWARSNDGDACERVEDRADRCGFVRGACGGLARGVDYLAFVYCGGGGREGLRLAALSLWLVLLLSLLGTTADVFFIEQLDFMAKRLRLSDDVAGATLMALGNGAPDVFTAWNAIQNAADFPLVLAELLGASIFITTVVLGVVILAAHGRARARRLDLQTGADGDEAPCQVDARPFARDVSVLGLSIFAISCCALDRSIDVTESAALLGLYACYVLAIVYAQRGDKDAGSDDERDRVAAAPLLAAGDAPAGLRLRGVHWGESPSAWDRVVHVAEWPFSAARHASIPPATFDDWSEGRRRLAACAVAGAVVVVVLDFGLGGDARALVAAGPDGPPPLVFAAGAGGGLAALAYACTGGAAPHRHAQTALVALGFLATVAWLDLLASETVAVLESLGAAAGLSSAVLGVTALAWGNCIGDLVADGAVARAGHARMAVASVFNSPLFSQINALGVPVAYYCYFHGPLRIALDPQAVLSFAVVAASILATALVARANDGALPRHHAFTLFGLYAAYVAAAVAVELHRASS